MRWSLLGVLAVSAVSLGLTSGCRCSSASAQQPVEQPKVERTVVKPAAAPAPVARSGMITQRVYFPGGTENCGVLLVEKSIPAELAAGKTAEYQIKATNVSGLMLNNVVVTENVPANATVTGEGVNVKGAGPAALNFGDLKPGESKTVKLSMVGAAAGPITMCTTAAYVPTFCMTNNVTNPALKIAKTGPAEVLLCDPFQYTIVVSNPGVGVARGVKVTDTLPQGPDHC